MNANRLAVALVTLAVVTGATAGVASAATDGSLVPDPKGPGETSTHLVTATAGADTAGSWNGFEVDYSESGADASNVDQNDVAKIGIDRGDDASGDTIDVNVSDDVDSVGASSNGEVLTIGLGGSYDVDEGDEVVVVYEDVQHPEEAGSYVTPLDINPQSSGGETTATLTVGSGTSDDTPTTEGDEQTPASTTGDSDGTTAVDTTDDSNANLPGFGIAVAALAIAGAALLAYRD
ncbi:hypothetical protein LPA44_04785 [Halobacterium sp. KA-4]|uniref:hypothetical protein n=1 Tax=Halobacterium sp. KA-4 TaxID=2896367 RepID=UPI001E37E3C1|nr:hypothetical protein [Halobacterium sp. KA-4]MCD2199216.1 hypothetical protein [Halobacterium sp. KA-4]